MKTSAIEWRIRFVIATLILTGIVVIMYAGPLAWIGIIIAGLGVLAIAAGWRTFSTANPYEVGILTIGGKYVKVGPEPKDGKEDTRKTVPVRGITVLAPYPPFFIDAVRLPMTPDEWKIPVTVLSVEDPDAEGDNKKSRSVPIDGTLTVVAEPDPFHGDDFVRCGGSLKKIREMVGNIPYRIVQEHVRTTKEGDNTNPGLSMNEIVLRGDIISKFLREKMAGMFGERSYGVLCKSAAADFVVPAQVKQAMIDAASIDYETAARIKESEGDVQSANLFKNDLGVKDEDKAWQMAMSSRMVRDGAVKRFQVETLGGAQVGGAFIFRDTNFAMGEGNKPNRNQRRKRRDNQ